MKKYSFQALAAIVFMFFSGSIIADTFANVYNCKLEEGKTAEDAHAANSKWLKVRHRASCTVTSMNYIEFPKKPTYSK